MTSTIPGCFVTWCGGSATWMRRRNWPPRCSRSRWRPSRKAPHQPMSSDGWWGSPATWPLVLEASGGQRSSLAPTAVLPGIAELRATARRLRAASQWVPLPDGRLAVRRALMALAQHDPIRTIPRRAAWRRAGLWLSTVAGLAAVIGAFGLGAGALDPLVPPSSPAYGVRLALNRVRDTLIPSQPSVGAYALTFEFSAAQVPSEPGATGMTSGKLGGLPATLS